MPKTAAKAKPASKTSHTSKVPNKAASKAPLAATPSPGTATASTLPRSLVNASPTGAAIIKHVQAIEALYPRLQQEIVAAEKAGAIPLARVFVVLHRLNERMLSEEKAFKSFKALWKETKEITVPEAFENAGVPSVPLEEGFRVSTSVRTLASIKEGQKAAAFKWLKDNGHGDVIQSVINASTLSALAKELGEKNIDMPDATFNVARVNNTSVTKT